MNADGRGRTNLQSAATLSRRAVPEIPWKWTELRAVSSRRFESMCVLGGAWPILMSPVFTKVGKRVVINNSEVSHPSHMNDVQLWQVVAASLAYVLCFIDRIDSILGLTIICP